MVGNQTRIKIMHICADTIGIEMGVDEVVLTIHFGIEFVCWVCISDSAACCMIYHICRYQCQCCLISKSGNYSCVT